MPPKVSVIMSVHNGADYVEQAIESILCQTYENFEFLIINDGSTDETAEILHFYSKLDGRIKIISQDNVGLTKSLNRLFHLSRGKYVARQDADDLSMPDRLACQVNFMEQNLNVAVVGSWYRVYFTNNVFWDVCLKTKHLKAYLARGINCFMHSSVLMRKSMIEIFDGPYRFRYAQDYDLWLRVSEEFKIAIIDKVLAIRKEHGGVITNKKQQTVRRLREAMLLLKEERLRYGKELSKWYDLEQAILNNPDNVNESPCTEYQKKIAFAYLMSGRRREAFRYYLNLFQEEKSLKRLLSLIFNTVPTEVLHFVFATLSFFTKAIPHKYASSKS